MCDKPTYPSWIDPDHIGTHYDGCEQHHQACAWILATEASERRIIEWLRAGRFPYELPMALCTLSTSDVVMPALADAIERGEHRG